MSIRDYAKQWSKNVSVAPFEDIKFTTVVAPAASLPWRNVSSPGSRDIMDIIRRVNEEAAKISPSPIITPDIKPIPPDLKKNAEVNAPGADFKNALPLILLAGGAALLIFAAMK